MLGIMISGEIVNIATRVWKLEQAGGGIWRGWGGGKKTCLKVLW